MTRDIVHKIEFQVFIKDIPDDISSDQVRNRVADKLSISLMLKELDVDYVYVNGHGYSLEKLRHRRYRK